MEIVVFEEVTEGTKSGDSGENIGQTVKEVFVEVKG